MQKMYDKNNIFYKIINKEIQAEIVAEGQYSLAFLDIHPKAPVHVLVIPKGEYLDFASLMNNGRKEEIECFFETLNAVLQKYNLVANGYRLISNNGEDGKQEVPHFHMHVLGGKSQA